LCLLLFTTPLLLNPGLAIAFSALPDDVLEPLVALSEFFKNLCAS